LCLLSTCNFITLLAFVGYSDCLLLGFPVVSNIFTVCVCLYYECASGNFLMNCITAGVITSKWSAITVNFAQNSFPVDSVSSNSIADWSHVDSVLIYIVIFLWILQWTLFCVLRAGIIICSASVHFKAEVFWALKLVRLKNGLFELQTQFFFVNTKYKQSFFWLTEILG